MTTVLDAKPNTIADDRSSTVDLAPFGARAGAFAVDVLLGIGVLAVLGILGVSAITVERPGWLWVVYAVAAGVVFLLMAINRLLLPATTGWSLGRGLFGIAVVRRDGAAVGAWRLLARDVAHLLDTAALLVGWLWPLWDARQRTFADLLLRTEVRRADPPQRDMRRLTAKVLVAAVVVCAAAVTLNYFVVYRHEQAVNHARQDITDKGPQIVEQLLSYHKDTMKDDFARAQSLTTDSYRSQLAAQQEAAEKAGATTNEYFAVSSAVLSATPERAEMLVALQGQRGEDAESLQFITATVRVDFVKSRGSDWRVSNLTVLKKPNIGQAPQ